MKKRRRMTAEELQALIEKDGTARGRIDAAVQAVRRGMTFRKASSITGIEPGEILLRSCPDVQYFRDRMARKDNSDGI